MLVPYLNAFYDGVVTFAPYILAFVLGYKAKGSWIINRFFSLLFDDEEDGENPVHLCSVITIYEHETIDGRVTNKIVFKK